MDFIKRQITEVQFGGRSALVRKARRALKLLPRVLAVVFAVPCLIVIRMIRPWLLVRIGGLISGRIGHFAANTELYLCEREAGLNRPTQRHVDVFYMRSEPVCNEQLATMWRRELNCWPAWFVSPIAWLNQLIPGGAIHDVLDRTTALDIYNLLDRFPPHLQFTAEEVARGEADLLRMGIPVGAPFVCLIVRDSAYLDSQADRGDWCYHRYRDSDIGNYALVAEQLAERGYHVVRMGAKVNSSFDVRHPRVIDYATNGLRSDFMDIYLGAKCTFCISTGTGWDAIPEMLRRPIVYVNLVPLAYLHTFRADFLSITKKHVNEKNGKILSVRDIFQTGAAYSLDAADFVSKGVKLVENTPEEIRDAAFEMVARLDGTWRAGIEDEILQETFWNIFSANLGEHSNQLHGDIRARYGAAFLRDNPAWLQ